MASYYFSPLGNSQLLSTSGAPLSGGTVTTFQAGTSTPQATYADNAGGTPSTSLTLNTYGLPTSPVWLLGGQAYKFVIKDSLGNTIRTVDNIAGIGDVIAITAGQKASIPAFSAYLSANQSVSTGVATKVLFDTKDFDTAICFTSSRFTPTVAGYYQVSAQVSMAVASGFSDATVALYKNGSPYQRGGQLNSSAGPLVFSGSYAGIIAMNGVTDFIEIFGTITGTTPTFTGGALRFSSFAACLIRAS